VQWRRRLNLTHRISGVALAGTLVLVGMESLSGVALASGAARQTPPTVPPTFMATLAGASVAAMYSSGFAWDPVNHRIVVADTGNNQIEFYSATGTLLGEFGSFGSGNGEFNSPREVTIDGSGNIYVADAGNSRVEAFTSTGGFLWATQDLPGWTNSIGGCLYPERNTVCLNQPIGVGWDPVGNALLVADTGDSYIKALNLSNGTWIATSPSGKNTLGFTDPRGVTRGPGGYIWVSAYEQNQIKAYQVTGTGSTQTWTLKVTLGSTAGHGNNQLSFPYNVAFSADSTYAYVADIGNDRIAIYNISNLSDPTWVGQYGSRCNQPCGDPGQTKGDTGKFAFLRRVFVEGSDGPNPGAVFGDDFWGNGMNAWNPPVDNVPGAFLEQISGVHAPAPGFAQAFGVAVGPGPAPSVYGVDRLNQRIEQFVQPTNAFVTASGVRGSTKVADGFSWPEDAAVAPDGTVWLADTRNSRLQHWPANLSTTGVTDVGSKGTGSGQFNYIEGLTVDSSGVVWVADTDNNRIESYNPTDSQFVVYGGLGSGVCQFDNPQGVAIGSAGQVYVADTLNNRIDEFTISGGTCNPSSWLTYSTGLHGPQGVAAAADGTLWVADSGNNEVVHLSGGLTNLGDGFGSLGNGTMQFDDPHSLAVYDNISTNTHMLYVADTYNNRIQEFNIAGA
jgi:tripartite motif-containing protein 71